jgi:hypothetical protein
MTPPKKAAPSLKELLEEGNKGTPEVVTPEVDPDTEVDQDLDDDENVTDNEPDPFFNKIPVDQNPVPTWEENHSHNLATVHPDVIPASPPSENASVTKTVTTFEYAGENPDDDKFVVDESTD